MNQSGIHFCQPYTYHDIPDGEFVQCPIVVGAKGRLRKAQQMVKNSNKRKKVLPTQNEVNIHMDALFSIESQAKLDMEQDQQ